MNNFSESQSPRTTCRCGCNDFFVNEGLTHKASAGPDNNGKLIVYKPDWAMETEDTVSCIDCGAEYLLSEFDSSELY